MQFQNYLIACFKNCHLIYKRLAMCPKILRKGKDNCIEIGEQVKLSMISEYSDIIKALNLFFIENKFDYVD